MGEPLFLLLAGVSLTLSSLAGTWVRFLLLRSYPLTADISIALAQSTMATSIGDFSRYASKPTSAIMQVLFFPGLWGFTSLLGAITSNMTLAIYGEIREFEARSK